METTINMNYNDYKDLNIISKKYNITKNRILKIILMEFDLEQKKVKLFNTVKYQKSNIVPVWKKFHFIMTPPEYERFTDMRNFYKMSLSLIVAIALEKYLHMIFQMKNGNKFTDIYPVILFPAYCIIYKLRENLKSYIIYWGVPEEIPEL